VIDLIFDKSMIEFFNNRLQLMINPISELITYTRRHAPVSTKYRSSK